MEGSAWKLVEDLTEGVLPTDRGWLRSRWSCKLLVVELFEERALVVSRETVRRVLHRLKKLTYMHVQGLYRQMQDRGLSARTVQYTHAVLHRALKQAVRWSLIPRNVCEGVDVPQVRREEMRPLNAEQARRLLRSASGERLEAFYVLAVHTGMRPGELLGLRWEDVTLSDEGGTLQLNRALSDGELATPKTKGSEAN